MEHEENNDKPSYDELAQKVNDLTETNVRNAERIGGLELKRDEAVDKAKRVMGLVRENLGINEISEDSLKSFVGNADEALRNDIGQLKSTLQEVTQERDSIIQNHKTELKERDIRDNLRALGVDSRLRGERAMNTLVSDLMNMAGEDENGNPVFKENGQTLFSREGNEMGVAEVVSELMQRDKDHFIFKETSGSGTEATNNTHFGKKSDISSIIDAGLKY